MSRSAEISADSVRRSDLEAELNWQNMARIVGKDERGAAPTASVRLDDGTPQSSRQSPSHNVSRTHKKKNYPRKLHLFLALRLFIDSIECCEINILIGNAAHVSLTALDSQALAQSFCLCLARPRLMKEREARDSVNTRRWFASTSANQH